MARSFNISAIFTAVNKLSAPVQQMSRSISQFAQVVSSTSASTKSAFSGLATSATSSASKISSAFNNINFKQLQFKIKNAKGSLDDLNSWAQKTAVGAGVFGYGAVKALDPVRTAEGLQVSLGLAHTNASASSAEMMKVGAKELAMVNEIAAKLSGEAPTYANLDVFLSNLGMEVGKKQLESGAAFAAIMGKQFDDQMMNQIAMFARGELPEELKSKGWSSDIKGNNQTLSIPDPNNRKGPHKKFNFEKGGEGALLRMKWLIEYVNKYGKNAIDPLANSVEGLESTLVDTFKNASKDIQNLSGWTDTYKKIIIGLTGAIGQYVGPLSDALKKVVEFAKAHTQIATVIGIVVGSIIGLSAAIAGISHIVMPFVIILTLLKGTLFGTATGLWAALSPILLMIGAFAAVAGAVAAAIVYWDELKLLLEAPMWVEYFQRLKQSASEMVDLGSNIVTAIKDGISSAWNGLVSWFSEKLASLVSLVPHFGVDFANSVTTSPSMKPPASTSGISSGQSSLASKQTSIGGVTNQAVSVNNNINLSIPQNGQPSVVSSTTSNNAVPKVVNNIGQSRRTSK